MPAAPLPANETQRLEKLRSYDILDTPPEAAFDRVTRIAARLFDMPISLVSLVDRDRQWFKSRVGLDAAETPRNLAFCAHAILDNTPLVVEDATADPRFADNPLVTGAPDIRFYAGAPLVTREGLKLGTMCVIDTEPRQFSDDDRKTLEELAQIAVDELELRYAARNALKENASLVRENASKDEFVSLVSHELRTPLTSITGGIALLEAGAVGRLPDKAQELIAIAKRNAQNLTRLIDDLLDFQKQSAGKLEFDFAPVTLADLIREAAENMAGYADGHAVAIAIVEPELAMCDTAQVLGDRMRLQQVLANLLSNAVKFSLAGETVDIGLTADNGSAVITVTDRGPGIPADFQARMFQMFAKAGGADQPAGTGVGLALSKAIVEAHGGTISFETSARSGTRFHVAIPLREALLGSLQERARA